jgi:hypothetical protein
MEAKMTDAEPSRISGAATAARASGAIEAVLGAGFGLGAIATLRHLEANGELPLTPFGFRSMSGPFEQLGQERFALLGWALVAVCVVDVVAGIWLWRRRRRGFRLGLVTAVPLFALGVGFALPFLLVGVPLRVALALAARRSLR